MRPRHTRSTQALRAMLAASLVVGAGLVATRLAAGMAGGEELPVSTATLAAALPSAAGVAELSLAETGSTVPLAALALLPLGLLALGFGHVYRASSAAGARVALSAVALVGLLLLPVDAGVTLASVPGIDKLGHFGLWLALALVLRAELRKSGIRQSALWTLLGALGLGIATELLQSAVGRQPELLDLAADMVGAALAVALTTTTRPREARFAPRPRAMRPTLALALPLRHAA